VIPAFVGLGSNQGAREAHLARALGELARMPESTLSGMSSLYETDPVGDPRFPCYLNAVARLETALEPEALWSELRRVEREGGRPETGRAGARTIDLDLLYYGDHVLRRTGLEIPHPWIADRLFVLVPMVELAPGWVDPVLRVPLAEILRHRRHLTSVRWAGRQRG